MSETKTRKFPLEKGHYFGTPTLSRLHHSGSRPGDDDQIRYLQDALGVPQSGVYDTATSDAVKAAQKKAKLEVTGLVDEATWKALKIQA